MPQGLIIKGIGGFYYVKTEEGIVECRARGKFRNENITPLVGDMVTVSIHNNSNSLDKIHERKNQLIRPPVANVDQLIIVFAAVKPEPNLELLDKFLIVAELNNMDIAICINKIDLIEAPLIEGMFAPYKEAGFNIIYTSTKKDIGIEDLKLYLKDKVSVFSGPSGVGKSSLLNKLHPSFNMETGEISKKIERGKQTTRHTQLLELHEGGYVADTPGFSSLEYEAMKVDYEELDYLFPEFRDFLGQCKFTGCSHTKEPGCAVKNAVEEKQVNKRRYESYVRMYDDIKKLGRNYR
ncbi:putative ribosome biogenesis GTPase RsgA [Oxobacter pfennigii]|uniref:Small ribosomal subunit biogenesis GTPase RsgA n=1 Tax=Oxobacter pfennigii TaxID=36849 RepID=A0A0P8WZP6_9CLOT|nr:ribosome small subunit-dependent GTPase A [Oxobacter pfennigii]KPU43972.1 putative ribosome biogenesis GTPase RsgA [Oxobacter pfennigii]